MTSGKYFIFYSVQMNYILSWSKQGSVMPSKAIEQNGVLLIPDLKRSDQGNYVCMGTDMFSEDSASVILIVEEGMFMLFSPLASLTAIGLKTTRIYHECEGRIEKSVPRVAVWHHKACRVMTNGDPEGQIFSILPSH